jgi:hypothetical protein
MQEMDSFPRAVDQPGIALIISSAPQTVAEVMTATS